MSEQAPDQHDTSGEPLRGEPSTYVEDSAKAEIMAYASENQEEQVVEARKKALGHVAHIGDIGMDKTGPNIPLSVQNEALHNARLQTAETQRARHATDEKADIASQVYDQVYKL